MSIITAPLTSDDMWQPAPESGVGADTLGLKGPADHDLFHSMCEVWIDSPVRCLNDSITGAVRGGKVWIPVGDAYAFVGFQTWNDEPSVTITMSLPKLLRPHNGEPVGFELIPMCADAIIAEVGRQLPGIPSVADVRLSRLDLVRDFACVSPVPTVLADLDSLPGTNIRASRSHKRADNTLQTLYRGTQNNWEARAYGKAHELFDHAPNGPDGDAARAWAAHAPNQLRFEVQMRRRDLVRAGLDHLDALHPDRLAAQTRSYFERTGWHQRVVGDAALAGVLDQIERNEGRTVAKNVQLYLDAQRRGVPPRLSHNPLDRARSVARSYRLCATSPRVAGSSYLDYESGRQVIEAC